MRKEKKLNFFLNTLIIITLGAFVSTAILSGTYIYVNKNISQNEASIETLSNELTEIKGKTEAIQGQADEYKSKLQALEAEISKYKPVVVPDSMK